MFHRNETRNLFYDNMVHSIYTRRVWFEIDPAFSFLCITNVIQFSDQLCINIIPLQDTSSLLTQSAQGLCHPCENDHPGSEGMGYIFSTFL